LIQGLIAAHEPAADRAERGQLTFTGRLYCRNGCVFRRCDFNQLPRATGRGLGNVEVIAHQMEKRFVADELLAAQHRVPITAGGILHNETHARPEIAAGLGERAFVARTHDDAELLDAGAGGFFEHDLEGGFRFAGLVDERLKRQGALAGIGSGNKDFADSHELDGGMRTLSMVTRCVQPETRVLRLSIVPEFSRRSPSDSEIPCLEYLPANEFFLPLISGNFLQEN
jgi:hypothetical protein